MTIHIVSNAVELSEALSNANGGDTIQMQAGHYGDLQISNLNFSSEVVLTGYDDTPPTLNSVNIWASSNLTFDGIDFDFQPTAETLEWDSALRTNQSSDIAIINSTIQGGDAVAGIDPDSEPGTQGKHGIDGYPIGVGLIFNTSTNITVENNTISDFTAGIRVSGVDGIEINHNEISDVRKVPVGGGDVSNVVMVGNYFHDLTPWKFGGLGDHGDHVHFWTRESQDGPSENFVFRDNFFAEGDGVPVLGIYMDNNIDDLGFRNVLIENNVMHNGNAQGLRLEDITGLQILNNTFVQSSGDETDAPRFYLHYGNTDVLIDGNIFAGASGPGLGNPERDNIVIGDNVVVQIHDPLAENFVGDLFVNGLADRPTLSDLSILPDTILSGYGASISQLPDNYISDARGNGLEIATHDFAVDLSQPGIVEWDFGDGATAEGSAVQHTYNTFGTHEVTATITFEDGSTETITRAIEALNPVGLQLGFEGGTTDGIGINGGFEFVEGKNGNAIKLLNTESTLSFEATEALTNNPEYTLSLAFQKEEGQALEGGRLLHFSGTAIIDLTDDGITLRGSTDAGERIVLRTDGLDIANNDWHQITYTASQIDGTAILYLNGQEIARMEGLEGAQHTTAGHNLHLGNPFGNSFTGHIDEPKFLRAALTPEEVAQSYAAFEAGTGMIQYVESDILEIIPQGVTSSQIVTPEAAREEVNETFSSSKVIELGELGVSYRIAREEVQSLLETETFSISMNLSADSSASAGEVVRLHQSFSVEIKGDAELFLTMFNDTGQRINLTTNGADLNNSGEHNIVISLADEVLNISVDGAILASTQMTGTLADIGAHDLVFGNPWGQRENFSGTLNGFEFTSEEPNYPQDEWVFDDMARVPDLDQETTLPFEIDSPLYEHRASAEDSFEHIEELAFSLPPSYEFEL